MFQVDRNYTFRMIRDGEEFVFEGTIASYEHPLIRLEDTEAPTINVSFVSPEPEPEASLAEVVAASYKEKPDEALSIGGHIIIKGDIINVTSVYFVSAIPK